jgi:hypothetical protein
MIKFRLRAQPPTLELVLKLGESTTWQICWDGTRNDASGADCLSRLSSFPTLFGGPHGTKQWTADGVREIATELFLALGNQYGPPVFKSII